jgi:glycerol-3-phosphate dehydrogenase
MRKVDEELVDRERLVAELVEHLFRMGGAVRTELPVSHLDAEGGLSLWKVTVERVKKLDFGAG